MVSTFQHKLSTSLWEVKVGRCLRCMALAQGLYETYGIDTLGPTPRFPCGDWKEKFTWLVVQLIALHHRYMQQRLYSDQSFVYEHLDRLRVYIGAQGAPRGLVIENLVSKAGLCFPKNAVWQMYPCTTAVNSKKKQLYKETMFSATLTSPRWNRWSRKLFQLLAIRQMQL